MAAMMSVIFDIINRAGTDKEMLMWKTVGFTP